MIELEAKLPDSPGALLKFLKPISENAGNIHGIFHTHKDKIGGMIPVLVQFEIIAKDKVKNLENIKKILQDMNIPILKITDIQAVHQMTVILSGHVFRSNVEEIIKELGTTGAKVHDLEAKFTNPEDISNVKFIVDIPDEMEDRVVVQKLEEICDWKDLFLLTEEIL
ncbi:MAG: hypothetical protein GF364_17360 [Candidatus Lokiarchaeota archaeon]|nr:hypothetical protein [Candidatus Lokiarchaeota archaeon]